VKYSFGCGYRRFTPMWNEEVLNFEDEILLRRVDCNISIFNLRKNTN
jgi:hypothetical protein